MEGIHLIPQLECKFLRFFIEDCGIAKITN